MAALLEGIESILLACSIVVLLPASLVVLVARRGRPWVAVGTVVGTAVMMWARAGRIWEVDADGVVLVPIAALIVSGTAVAARLERPAPAVRLGLGALAGAVAAWLWQPCVGAEFAEILNRAETDRLGSLVGMHAHVAGVLLPVTLLATLGPAVPEIRPILHHRVVQGVAFGATVLYAGAVVTGRYGDLVAELFRISSA